MVPTRLVFLPLLPKRCCVEEQICLCFSPCFLHVLRFCHALCLHNPRHHYYYWFCYCDYHHHYYCYIYITPSTRTIVAVTIPTAIAATSAGV